MSLDIQRGLTIAAMIFADEIGGAFPHLNHSPWNNVTFADFVMPWFLFMAGMAMAFSLRKYKGSTEKKKQGTHAVVVRALKLFFLGVAIQGGGWPAEYVYGYNLWNMRWCGILQRIAYGYLVVALLEIWMPLAPVPACLADHHHPNINDGGDADTAPRTTTRRRRSWGRLHMQVLYVHGYKWAACLLTVGLYTGLLYGTRVPSWTVDVDGPDKGTVITCDVRGELTPACAATGYYDRLLFGQKMCGAWMSSRLPECSSCSPGDHVYSTGASCVRADAPAWCRAPSYDPEGALATSNVVISTWLGLHFGHVLKHGGGALKAHGQRLLHWAIASALLVAVGLLVHFSGWQKMNKQLWTTSYAFFTAGVCGAFLCLWYTLVDGPVRGRARSVCVRILSPLQYMGQNAILVFFWHGLATAVLNTVYWQPHNSGTKHNLIGWLRDVEDADTCAGCQLAFVLCKIACFAAGCCYCARVGYFWKL